MEKKIVVRVYGLWIKGGKILLSDERLRGFSFTKFPGGGLEFGEGTAACLVRELKEETGEQFNIISHFYTTDFFQSSAFASHHQIISVYYLVEGGSIHQDLLTDQRMDFKTEGDEMIFRWVSLQDLTEEDVTFPIDKHVVSMIRNQFS